MADYEEPNQWNVKNGDCVLEIYEGAVRNIQITEATELSAKTFHNNEKGEPVWGTHPYITSIIKKANGVILVGKRISSSALEETLRII